MYKLPPGPCAFFDVDDTLVSWKRPDGSEKKSDIVSVSTRGVVEKFVVNTHNVDFLKKLAVRGHAIVVWSKGGVDWAEAVVSALGIKHLVGAVLSKPTYFVDDIKDPNKFMGEYVFFDLEGNRHEHISKNNQNNISKE